MTKSVRCFCGFQAIGDEDSIVSALVGHALEFHQMTMEREQVLAMAEPVKEA
jgi:hypothetical protein